jgi:glutaredoxin 3
MAEIEIYTQPGCPYCARAKDLLRQRGVAFREIDAPAGSAARAESIRRADGRTSVPQIFIDGTAIGGSDDLAALDGSGRLAAMLAGET